MCLVFTLAQTLFLLAVIAIVAHSWLVVPWGLCFAVCLFLSTIPAGNLTSVLAPHRARFAMGNANQGNLWLAVAWFLSIPPVCLLFMLPLVFWPQALAVTLPLAALYGVALYIITLKPVARLLDRHAHTVFEAVTGEV
jgi:hypothetical protein